MSDLFLYRLYGHTLASNVELPVLQPAEGEADFRFEMRNGGASTPHPDSWILESRLDEDDERPWCQTARTGSGYLLRFSGIADFVVGDSLSQISCRPVPGTAFSTATHLLLDTVLPRVLSHKGALVFHASAVRIEGRLTVLLGASGSGKSTLATWLARHGGEFVCDDCLVMRRTETHWRGFAGYPGVRLWPESLGELFPTETGGQSEVAEDSPKKRIQTDWLEPGRAAEASEVTAAFSLTEAGPVAAVRLPPREAFFTLLSSSFVLDPRDSGFLAGQFADLQRLTDDLPVYRLSYPRLYESLPQVSGAIEDALGMGQGCR